MKTECWNELYNKCFGIFIIGHFDEYAEKTMYDDVICFLKRKS